MAESPLSSLSLGHLADRLARAAGWSPLARTIRISSVEGPSASLFEDTTGTVSSVEENVMILKPYRTDHSPWAEGTLLRLTARHRGWTPFSMYLRPIAVVAEVLQADGREGPVAIGLAAVVNKRGRVARD